MKSSILIDREDHKKIESQKKYEFLIYVLEGLGISPDQLEKCFPTNQEEQTVAQRILLRKLYNQFKISLSDIPGGELKVYVDNGTQQKHDYMHVATWEKPQYKLHVKPSSVQPMKDSYYEMQIEWWTIFENNEEEK